MLLMVSFQETHKEVEKTDAAKPMFSPMQHITILQSKWFLKSAKIQDTPKPLQALSLFVAYSLKRSHRIHVWYIVIYI